MTLKVIVHKADEGGFWAEVPAIPGCATEGETFEELLKNLYEAVEVELWRVPAGADNPVPKPTVDIKDVTFKGLRKSLIEPYDCCDDPTFMWNEFKKNSETN